MLQGGGSAVQRTRRANFRVKRAVASAARAEHVARVEPASRRMLRTNGAAIALETREQTYVCAFIA
jgi:hypothetical protein